jgi:lipopolysaccharide transport protein LptA
MAPSLQGNLCVCGFALALALAGGAQEDGSEKQELVLDSGPLAFNGQTNLFEVETPRIRQGDVYIQADRAVATSIEFDKSSEWRFTGNVRIEAGTAVMEAASAVFTFADEQLARGELEGGPASFSDVGTVTKASITGRAQKMSYDYVARTLRMTGDVWMQKDKTEMRACEIAYALEAERITSDCADGLRVTVIPDSNERAAPPSAPQ